MKFLSIFILLCSASAFGQDSSAFKLTLTTFNHAERIFDGTTTFILTPSSLTVTKTYLENQTKTVYSKKISDKAKNIKKVKAVDLQSLKDLYFNYCVLPTSGDEYFLQVTNNSNKRQISLHHYYLPALNDIIAFLNDELPKRHQFHYLGKDTKQDCNP